MTTFRKVLFAFLPVQSYTNFINATACFAAKCLSDQLQFCGNQLIIYTTPITIDMTFTFYSY